MCGSVILLRNRAREEFGNVQFQVIWCFLGCLLGCCSIPQSYVILSLATCDLVDRSSLRCNSGAGGLDDDQRGQKEVDDRHKDIVRNAENRNPLRLCIPWKSSWKLLLVFNLDGHIKLDGRIKDD